MADDAAPGRSRRQKQDRHGRFAALEKLKQLKGTKHKYEVEDLNNVYEEVDEKEYSRRVIERQEDDWIIDDNGSGYVEDGREIFDDELDGDAPPRKTKAPEKKGSKNPHVANPNPPKKHDIKSMFKAMPMKKKKAEQDVKLEEDDILGSILQDLHKEPSVPKPITPTVLRKKTPKIGSVSISANTSSRYAPQNPFACSQETPKRSMANKIFSPRQVEFKDDLPQHVHKKRKLSEHLPSESQEVSIEQFDSQKLEKSKEIKIEMDEFEENLDEINFDDDFSMDIPKEEISSTSQKENLPQHASENIVKVSKETNGIEDFQFNNDIETMGEVFSNVCPEGNSDVQVNSSQLPLTSTEDGQILRFFWLDAFEDPFKQPGVVYLFGKVHIPSADTYVSCCLTVKNIERRIFLLPRERRKNLKTGNLTDEIVEKKDVYMEFNDTIANKYKMTNFRSRFVKKNYSFEKAGVPTESEYFEVKYSAEYPALPSDLQGETFSHVFGTTSSCLELLLLDCKMKGPSWLDIKNPSVSNVPISWCKIEAFVDKPECISVSTKISRSPPVVVMALGIKTIVTQKTQQNEIIFAAGFTHKKFYMDKTAPKPLYQDCFCGIARPSDGVYPYDFKSQLKAEKDFQRTQVEKLEGERSLLGYLLAKIHKLDPDIIVGHDIFGFDLDVLVHRLVINKIANWSRLGRLKRSQPPKLQGKFNQLGRTTTCGRILCDVKISSKELIRCKSYELTDLVSQVLHKTRTNINVDEIRTIFHSTQQLISLIKYSLVDVYYSLELLAELNILPLALQITNIAGNLLSRTLLGGRAERNEFLLLHAFNEKQFIVPDKFSNKSKTVEWFEEESTSKSKKGKKKAAYAGGLVLEPKKGFYDTYILLMDFNSLYPSIIQEYNICFTTISCSSKTETNEGEDSIIPDLPDPDLELGILPTEICKLVESRRQVKNMMKNPDLAPELRLQYDIRQKALKLTANSMYGCLGFSNSRFYAKPLAALITSRGRQILLQTKEMVQKMNLEVIYGDTDSIMINSNSTDFDEVMKLGNKVKLEVNKLYRQLEIDIDGVFKSMLLLKKKKYAALVVQKMPNGNLKFVPELKGLDVVRRDWSEIASETGKQVIDEILSDKPSDQIIANIQKCLRDVASMFKYNNVSLNKLCITKQLTKNPEDYPDKKNQPHVSVAIRWNSRGGKKLRQGDTVPYIICDDESNNSAVQRAFHIEEVKTNTELKIDVNYYLAHQIHPVVSRLCDPIEGIDAVRIAECLGLDPSSYRKKVQEENESNPEFIHEVATNDEDKFKDCEKFKFNCPKCQQEVVIEHAFQGSGIELRSSLAKCSNENCNACPAEFYQFLCNKLTRLIRGHIQKYYIGWLYCDDASCQNRIRRLPLRFSQGSPLCNDCEKGPLKVEYSALQLYNQLCFYQKMFDVERCKAKMSIEEADAAEREVVPYRTAYRRLKSTVDAFINQSAFAEVNLGRLFSGLYTKSAQASQNHPLL